jgi:hypothetical protein
MPREAIQITLPDGAVKDGTSWETSPLSIATGISKGLADKTVIAKVCSYQFASSHPISRLAVRMLT